MNTFNRYDAQRIAIAFDDGTIGVMQFITRAWNDAVPLDEQEVYEREATDEAIEREIAKSPLPKAVTSWRRVRPEDLPASRENRDAWRDDGVRVAVDPTKIRPNVPTLEERIAALEASEAALANRIRGNGA